jgi:hypothetical protein
MSVEVVPFGGLSIGEVLDGLSAVISRVVDAKSGGSTIMSFSVGEEVK